MSKKYRVEQDFLGEMKIPADKLHGIHTERALENFPIAGRPIHPALIEAHGTVKLACTITNRDVGAWKDDSQKADAIEAACREMAEGRLNEHIVVDLLQGGAGTSTNMNVNEVIANRALQILGDELGNYSRISPLDDINLHQSTNDTYPTSLKLAAIMLLRQLEEKIVALQQAFQELEKRFAHVVKVGRTQFQDAVLTTLGREMSAYAEVMGRDRWRVYKCEERLRVVNLGGTAIGTGQAAPRQYIFGVVDVLRELTGIPFARAENLVDATQNSDLFVEVSGILKAHASSLLKICTDLRFLSSGPEAGIGEIRLPQRQAGSTIMPGKVNPVIPEAVSQAAMQALGHDQTIALAVSSGNLELNAFLPRVAACMLDGLDHLAHANDILCRHCVVGIEADEERCRRHVEGSTAAATALVPEIGYEGASKIAKLAKDKGISIRQAAVESGALTAEKYDELTSPEAVFRLGLPRVKRHATVE